LPISSISNFNKTILNTPTPHISFKISFIILIGNNPFTKQSNFQLVTMSNLVISLSILILVQIINMCGSIYFFLQNSKGSHSWLFYLNNSIKTSNLPNCFLQLWDYFSCIYKLIKHHPLVETGYIYFKQNFKPFETEKKFPLILSFCSKFFIPWVYSWYFDYNT